MEFKIAAFNLHGFNANHQPMFLTGKMALPMSESLSIYVESSWQGQNARLTNEFLYTVSTLGGL